MFLQEQLDQGTRLRRWASTVRGSFPQPYLHLADVKAARRFLRLRLDVLPTEDNVRSRPHYKGVERALDRIDNEYRRACYNCAAIDDEVPDVFWPESLEHVLLCCNHAALSDLRDTAREELRDIANDTRAMRLAHESGAAVPRFLDGEDTALLVALQLRIGVGPQPAVRVPVPLAPAAVRRDGPQFRYDPVEASATAAWVNALTSDWCDVHRCPQRNDNLYDHPGGRLCLAVARHAVAVFATRRRALKANPEFAVRSRDPLGTAASAVPSSHTAGGLGTRRSVTVRKSKSAISVRVRPVRRASPHGRRMASGALIPTNYQPSPVASEPVVRASLLSNPVFQG